MECARRELTSSPEPPGPCPGAPRPSSGAGALPRCAPNENTDACCWHREAGKERGGHHVRNTMALQFEHRRRSRGPTVSTATGGGGGGGVRSRARLRACAEEAAPGRRQSATGALVSGNGGRPATGWRAGRNPENKPPQERLRRRNSIRGREVAGGAASWRWLSPPPCCG